MKEILLKTRDRFARSALGCMAFAAVYECFSHQVYSPFMLLAFLFPLLMGVVPYAVLSGGAPSRSPGVMSRYLYNSGVAALTAASLFSGILEIYGTTSRLEAVYWAVGILGLLSAVGMYLVERWERSAEHATK